MTTTTPIARSLHTRRASSASSAANTSRGPAPGWNTTVAKPVCAGGTRAQAKYDLVSGGTTGHAEAVKVVYDPAVVRYDQLLRVFFSVVADPTLRNRQGPDVGPQYNASLIPLSDEQRAVARAYLAQMKASGVWDKPIVTGIDAAGTFYPAEAYHQDFARKNPNHGYIKRWDAPKVAALKKLYPSLYSASFQTG